MTQAKIRIMPGRRAGLASYPAYTGPQASAATFKQGAPVKLSSGNLAAVSGTASEGTSSGLTIVATASVANLIGIADGLAVSSATSDIVVTRITEGQGFIGNLIHGASAASAVASKRGTTVYLAKVTGETNWGFAVDNASTFTGSGASVAHGKIIDFIDPASTANGRVLVEFTKGGGLFV